MPSPSNSPMPAVAKSTRKPALFTDISEHDRASKRPSIDPAAEGPYNLTRVATGSPRTASELRLGKRNPCPQPNMRPESMSRVLPPKSVRARSSPPVSTGGRRGYAVFSNPISEPASQEHGGDCCRGISDKVKRDEHDILLLMITERFCLTVLLVVSPLGPLPPFSFDP